MPAPPAESEPATARAIEVMTLLSAELASGESARSADPRKAREQFEHPACNQGHGVGEEQNSGQHEEATEQLLDGGEMLPEPLQSAHERFDGDRGGDERDTEAERIHE